MSDDAAAQKARTSRQFNARAADFDPHGVFAHFGRRLVTVVGVESGQRVLDVATGRGAVLNVNVMVDSMTFHYADVEDYWQNIRGTPPGRIVDRLAADQVERVRAGLTERLRAHQQADGIHVTATALLAVADR